MSLKLTVDHLQALRSHVEHAYPNECCGLLLGRRAAQGHYDLVDIRAVENTWDEDVAKQLNDDSSLTQARRYAIAPQTMLAIMREAKQIGCDIIGIYHSHPDHPAVPSDCDRRLAWPQYSYLILSVHQGICQDIQSWRLNEAHQFQPEAIDLPSLSTPQTSTS
ncbi:MAG: M67 family metallopeptidase [Leptolyngbyaceae cyanobacterium bins.349]|nr:M67 family metallopeptidase [Leptolyngbyaceae cyanobacterium bins.349]